jgi:ADP-ribose pyrophosphatase YjhB (NUDIX family)
METKLVMRLLTDADLPGINVSAVFITAFSHGRILAVRNERGWDIPGGYLEPDESPQEALDRELIEEAAASVQWKVPYAILSNPRSDKIMLVFAGEGIALGEFAPRDDALGREMLTIDELIHRYYGDKNLLRDLITAGRRRLDPG